MTQEQQLLFKQYIKSDCNRLDFIQDFLYKNDLESVVLPIDGKNHLYVKFPANQYNPLFKIKTVINHYDRVEDSPGANDNSFANFCMLLWAVKLVKLPFQHNIRLIFTDGEELGKDGISAQGSYGLAQLYKKLSILKDDIFVFDSIGRGTVPVVCEPVFSKASKEFLKKYEELENKAIGVVRTAANGKWFKLPAGLSDNAGFIANGLPAVAITMLPSEEIERYVNKLMGLKNPSYDYIRTAKDMEDFIPKTWRMFHTEEDNFENLDVRSYSVVENILEKLTLLKSLAK